MAQTWIARGFGGLDVLTLVETEVRPPSTGEVTIGVRAAGVNPADYKHLSPERGTDRPLPLSIGYEVAGVITAIGPDTTIASGGGAIGDEVVAFRVRGGYASEITVPARDVFAKPDALDFPAAANLLLAGATAAEMLHVTGVAVGQTILVHGASGAVGVSILQQARILGATVVGTASERNFDLLRGFGAIPIPYGPGIADRVRQVSPAGIHAALDTVGTQEALDASLELVPDRGRIVTIVQSASSRSLGIRILGGARPESAVFRAKARQRLLDWAAAGRLVVPVVRTFPLTAALEALELVRTGHPGGKLALIP